jgi:hypothetical protein
MSIEVDQARQSQRLRKLAALCWTLEVSFRGIAGRSRVHMGVGGWLFLGTCYNRIQAFNILRRAQWRYL